VIRFVAVKRLVFLFRKPTDDQIRDYLARMAEQPFSYDCVGCTRDAPARRPGWNIDRHRVRLGQGELAFPQARDAIAAWQMFPREIATICWPERPTEGLMAAVLYWAAPVRLWITFPTRVVYVIDDSTCRDGHTIQRFGFAYGTLPDHPERGEERFLVEWNRTDDSVWYDLMAVSRPAHWMARFGYPYTRFEQSRFRRLSGVAMQQAVTQSAPQSATSAAQPHPTA
jgi:uncharacterized protein (UPF0548 family)